MQCFQALLCIIQVFLNFTTIKTHNPKTSGHDPVEPEDDFMLWQARKNSILLSLVFKKNGLKMISLCHKKLLVITWLFYKYICTVH